MKARFYFDVAFKASKKVDAEGIASAMDNVVKTGMSALSNSWDEYGGVPKVGGVFVLDTDTAVQHVDALVQTAIEGLVEHYPQLKRKSVVESVREQVKAPDTGNDQADYENVRNQIEVILNKQQS